MSELQPSTSFTGKLTRSSSGWILLSLPSAIQRGFFQILDAPGAELPKRNGRINCHVSVIRPEELEKIGNPPINEIGKSFAIQFGKIVETNPIGWDEMDRVWFMKITSPELVKLRRSYGLSDLPKRNRTTLGFHMTIAVRRKGVLKEGPIAKEADGWTWDMVPKVAAISAAALQDAAAEQAYAQLDRPRYSNTIEALGAIGQLWSGKNLGIPNTPSALASMLTLGILGAGLGYGTGRIQGNLINMFADNAVDPKKTARSGALIGLGAGLIPGLLYAAGNYKAGKPVFTGAFLNDRDPQLRYENPLQKYSSYSSGVAFDPDMFAKLINEDPTMRQGLDPRERAMATGLVVGAKHLPGRPNSSLVTPLDVTRMAMGMGTGYLSGAVVGKTLGALMGLSKPLQQELVRSGTFAGMVKNLIPIAYGY
jgi:hypothetical protein